MSGTEIQADSRASFWQGHCECKASDEPVGVRCSGSSGRSRDGVDDIPQYDGQPCGKHAHEDPTQLQNSAAGLRTRAGLNGRIDDQPGSIRWKSF